MSQPLTFEEEARLYEGVFGKPRGSYQGSHLMVPIFHIAGNLMQARCIDGPCSGETHPIPDDAAVGHTIRRAVPALMPQEDAEEAFERFRTDPGGTRDGRLVQRFATYVYTGDGLKHVG